MSAQQGTLSNGDTMMLDRMVNWRHPDMAKDTATAMDIAEAAHIIDKGTLPLTALVVAIQYGRAKGFARGDRGGSAAGIIVGGLSGFCIASALYAILLWLR